MNTSNLLVAIFLSVSFFLPRGETGETEPTLNREKVTDDLQQQMDLAFPLASLSLRSQNGLIFDREQSGTCLLDAHLQKDSSSHTKGRWGFFVQFDSATFRSFNSVRCGNEPHFVTSGKWKWINENRLRVFDVTTATYGWTNNPGNESETKRTDDFVVSWTDETKSVLELTPVEEEDETDSLAKRMNREFPIRGLSLTSLSGHVFVDDTVESYKLELPAQGESHLPHPRGFGQVVQFNDGTFTAYTATMCGNDSNIYTTGKWKWVAENRIEVFVESIKRNEYCDKPGEDPKKVIGIFDVSWKDKEKSTLTLMKTKNHASLNQVKVSMLFLSAAAQLGSLKAY